MPVKYEAPTAAPTHSLAIIYARSGAYYVPVGHMQTKGFQAQGSGDTRWAQIDLRTSGAVTFDRIGCETTTSPGSGNIRLGIFACDTDGLPGALVLDAGQVDSATAAVKEITISQSLSPGRYWLAVASQGATVSIRTISNPVVSQFGISSAANAAGAGASLVSSGITGAFASDPTVATGDSIPVVFLRAA